MQHGMLHDFSCLPCASAAAVVAHTCCPATEPNSYRSNRYHLDERFTCTTGHRRSPHTVREFTPFFCVGHARPRMKLECRSGAVHRAQMSFRCRSFERRVGSVDADNVCVQSASRHARLSVPVQLGRTAPDSWLRSAGSKSCSSIAESNAADVVRSWCMFVKYLRMVLLHARTLSSE